MSGIGSFSSVSYQTFDSLIIGIWACKSAKHYLFSALMIELKDFTASLVHCQVCRQIIQHLPNCRQISIVWDRKCSFDFSEKCLPHKNISFHTRKVFQMKIRTVSQIQKTLHFCNVFSSSVFRTFYNWTMKNKTQCA